MNARIILTREGEITHVIVPHCPMFDFDNDNDEFLAPFLAVGWEEIGHVDRDPRVEGWEVELVRPSDQYVDEDIHRGDR